MMGIKIDTHRTGAVWLLMTDERNIPVFFFVFGVRAFKVWGCRGRKGGKEGTGRGDREGCVSMWKSQIYDKKDGEAGGWTDGR